MTAYFDEANRQVSDIPKSTEQDFLSALWKIEKRVKDDVRGNLADEEFPADLRAKIERAIFENEIQHDDGNTNDEPQAMACATRSSELLSALHSAYHELARRRVKVRFTAWLSDDPSGNNRLRVSWEATPPEER